MRQRVLVVQSLVRLQTMVSGDSSARASGDLGSACVEIQLDSPTSFSIECDLSQPESIDLAVDSLQELDAIDGIVYTGTIAPIQSMFDADDASWERNIYVNVTGVQRLTRGLYSKMKETPSLSSHYDFKWSSVTPLHSWSAYCISKAGLDMWSRCSGGRSERWNYIHRHRTRYRQHRHATGIRSSSSEDFVVDSFIGYHRDGDLTRPDDVAAKLHAHHCPFIGTIGTTIRCPRTLAFERSQPNCRKPPPRRRFMPGTDRVEIRTLKVGRFCVVDDEAYKILSIRIQAWKARLCKGSSFLRASLPARKSRT